MWKIGLLYNLFVRANSSLYCALVRSVLEYSSITYHSMLTKKLENDLEMVQKKCLRCIYGYAKSYEDLLKESGLLRLRERREIAVLKFAKKTSANPIYGHWFPTNPNPTSQRRPQLYKEEFACTNRLYNSSIFHMRRLLNESEHDNTPDPHYIDLAYLFDDL